IQLVCTRHNNSTSNLKNHALQCSPPKEKAGLIQKLLPGGTYTKLRMRFKLMEWIVRHRHPYAVVEDPELKEIFQMLYACVEVPSARTILRDVQEIFELS
ncbi:hypothetical protein SCHPADRAFT_813571, partial [Schizopora paradoxa]